MGGDRDSIVSQGTHGDYCLEEDFSLISSQSPSPLPRDHPSLRDEDNSVNGENGFDFTEIDEECIRPFSEVNCDSCEKKRFRIYEEILKSYDELRIDSKHLREAKEKILRYRPGTWIEKVGGLKLSDYDVPEITCLILVGQKGSGKSSLINRISKVFENDKFAPARAQVSYNSLEGDGTYFLREYMIPRDSNSICLYDTRSLSDNLHENENNKMLKTWMTKGVHHGELVVRNIDNQMLRENLKHKAYKKGFLPSKSRKVNFVIYVVDGLSVLNAMENTSTLEMEYIETIVSTFNCPFLSFRDDKPVLAFTHGDLLSLSDRTRVCAYLGELLGIPPTEQIFDIPDCDDLVTEAAIIRMLLYSLEHADRNFPQKSKVMEDKGSMTEALVELGNQNQDEAALTQVAQSESQALSITFTAADSQNLQTEQYLDSQITKAMSTQSGTAPQLVHNRVDQMIDELVKITGEKLSDSERQCLKTVLENEPKLRFVLHGWRLRGKYDLSELRSMTSTAQECLNILRRLSTN